MSERRRGFTLVEVAVAVAILAVVTTLSINFFGRTRRQQSLQSGARALLGALNNARALAASGREISVQPAPHSCIVNCDNPDDTSNNTPPPGVESRPTRNPSERAHVATRGPHRRPQRLHRLRRRRSRS